MPRRLGPAADEVGSTWIWSPTRLTDAEPVTGATDIRGFSKRTAAAGLNEGGEGGHRLEKARFAGQCTGLIPCGRVY